MYNKHTGGVQACVHIMPPNTHAPSHFNLCCCMPSPRQLHQMWTHYGWITLLANALMQNRIKSDVDLEIAVLGWHSSQNLLRCIAMLHSLRQF